MYDNIEWYIYYFVHSYCTGKRCVMVTSYVPQMLSFLFKWWPRHHFCLGGIYVIILVTPTVSSLTVMT